MKPLILQLAGRAGLPVPAAGSFGPGHCDTYAVSKLLFALCAHLDEQQEAAAVPAGNQAKAPTALDELLILTARQRDDAWDALTESREALARVEAEREYWRRAAVTEGEYRDQNNAIAAHWQAECIKRDAVIEAAIKVRAGYGLEQLNAALDALDQAASEAAVSAPVIPDNSAEAAMEPACDCVRAYRCVRDGEIRCCYCRTEFVRPEATESAPREG